MYQHSFSNLRGNLYCYRDDFITARNEPSINNILQHLSTHSESLKLSHNGLAFHFADEAFHQAAYVHNPEFYALPSLTESVKTEQQVRILLQLLRTSRAEMAQPVRETLVRVTNLLMAILPADQVLTVFLALRRLRANYKHITRADLNYIFNHPCLEDLAVKRGPWWPIVLHMRLVKMLPRSVYISYRWNRTATIT
ncbi:MAG: hypothetical protein AB1489_23380 [Acidobacteriota bacterium]